MDRFMPVISGAGSRDASHPFPIGARRFGAMDLQIEISGVDKVGWDPCKIHGTSSQVARDLHIGEGRQRIIDRTAGGRAGSVIVIAARTRLASVQRSNGGRNGAAAGIMFLEAGRIAKGDYGHGADSDLVGAPGLSRP